MVRFLGIAPLLVISHIALVVTAVPHVDNTDTHDVVARAGCQDPKASESYHMQPSKLSCSPCTQRSARIIRVAPQEPFVAVARTMDIRAWIQYQIIYCITYHKPHPGCPNKSTCIFLFLAARIDVVPN